MFSELLTKRGVASLYKGFAFRKILQPLTKLITDILKQQEIYEKTQILFKSGACVMAFFAQLNNNFIHSF
jgi:ATP-dependent RNA circularization protein (DNA/RNA ligase family)